MDDLRVETPPQLRKEITKQPAPREEPRKGWKKGYCALKAEQSALLKEADNELRVEEVAALLERVLLAQRRKETAANERPLCSHVLLYQPLFMHLAYRMFPVSLAFQSYPDTCIGGRTTTKAEDPLENWS